MSIFDELGRPVSACTVIRQEFLDTGGGVGASGTTSPPSTSGTAGGGGISPSEAMQTGYRFEKESINTPQTAAQRSVTVLNTPLYEEVNSLVELRPSARFAGDFIDQQSVHSSKRTLENSDSLRYALAKTWGLTNGVLSFYNKDSQAERNNLQKSIPFRITFSEAEYSENNRLESLQTFAAQVDPEVMSPSARYAADFTLFGSNKFYFSEVYWKGKLTPQWQLITDSNPRFSKPAFPIKRLSSSGENTGMPRNSWFRDGVFTTSMALHAKEADYLSYNSGAPIVDIETEVLYDDHNEHLNSRRVALGQRASRFRGKETNKTSLYRLYANMYKQSSQVAADVCTYEDLVQKYTCANSKEMIEVVNSHAVTFDSSVKIKITNPDRFTAPAGGPPVATILDLIAKYNMDQIFLSLLDHPVFSRVTQKFTEVYDEKIDALGPVQEIRKTENDRVTTSVNYSIVEDVERHLNSLPSIKYELWQPKVWKYPLWFKKMSPLESYIKTAMFLSEFKDLIRTRGLDRTIQEIFDGTQAPSFTIGYKIVKTNASSPKQTYYIMRPKTSEGDFTTTSDLTFVDTQVNIGSNYEYEIFSINLVIGTKYRYDSLSVHDPVGEAVYRSAPHPRVRQRYDQLRATAGGLVSISARSKPCINLVEVPFYKNRISVLPAPPMPPETSFQPYRGQDTKVGICFFSAPGEVIEEPIEILPSDKPTIDKMKERDSYKYGNKVRYVNDSLPFLFEIIRLDFPPRNYADFSNSRYVREVRATGKTGLSVQDIEPNKTYYYMFRTKDESGISNPSKIYQFTMISYSNGIYMDLKEYTFKNSIKPFLIKMKNTLKIMPHYRQTMLNFEEDISKRKFYKKVPDEQNVDLGHHIENEVWGRTFRIKLKSKSTGRSMWVKFQFDKIKKTFYPPEPPVLPDPPAPCGTLAEKLRTPMAGSAVAAALINSAGNAAIHSQSKLGEHLITGGGIGASPVYESLVNKSEVDMDDDLFFSSTGGGGTQSEIDDRDRNAEEEYRRRQRERARDYQEGFY